MVESGLVCDAVIRLFLDVSINLRFCYIPHLRTHIERERERERERVYMFSSGPYADEGKGWEAVSVSEINPPHG